MTDQKFSRRTLGALAAAGFTSAAAPALAAPKPRTPRLEVGAAAPEAAPEQALNRYGDRGPGWSGADSTYSIPLSGTTSALVFSDTFLGPVAEDGSRSTDSPFLNNSLVLTTGPLSRRPRFRTVTGHRDGTPTGIVSSEDASSSWYWFGDGVRRTGSEVEIMALRFSRTGDGPFDFAWSSTAVARIDVRRGTLHSLREAPSDTDIQWASWIEPVGPWLYVYGVRDRGEDKALFLARTPRRCLAQRKAWRFWTGSSWSRTGRDAEQIAPNVANEVSVARFRGGSLLITQDTSASLNPQVIASWAPRPEGPFTERVPLFSMDSSGTKGTQVYAYNAHEHPEWRRGNTVLVSYNVNSFDSDELYRDASIYRPRFIRIPVSLRHRS